MKTTTEPESRESNDDLDPDFDIGATGGPSDSGGDPHTGPPPKLATKTTKATKTTRTTRTTRTTKKKGNVRR